MSGSSTLEVMECCGQCIKRPDLFDRESVGPSTMLSMDPTLRLRGPNDHGQYITDGPNYETYHTNTSS
ncbi:hypothetical protein IAQ61_007879 [Plenodomus lingam]|uniref:uncharacterized protein n=1 Tax=Leptosphaeria maculans TaxID=5022 RepID=UPI003323FEC0|nr:hypothetical protein IAQ61_007879 [Plenodomus lingam]